MTILCTHSVIPELPVASSLCWPRWLGALYSRSPADPVNVCISYWLKLMGELRLHNRSTLFFEKAFFLDIGLERIAPPERLLAMAYSV